MIGLDNIFYRITFYLYCTTLICGALLFAFSNVIYFAISILFVSITLFFKWQRVGPLFILFLIFLTPWFSQSPEGRLTHVYVFFFLISLGVNTYQFKKGLFLLTRKNKYLGLTLTCCVLFVFSQFCYYLIQSIAQSGWTILVQDQILASGPFSYFYPIRTSMMTLFMLFSVLVFLGQGLLAILEKYFYFLAITTVSLIVFLIFGSGVCENAYNLFCHFHMEFGEKVFVGPFTNTLRVAEYLSIFSLLLLSSQRFSFTDRKFKIIMGLVLSTSCLIYYFGSISERSAKIYGIFFIIAFLWTAIASSSFKNKKIILGFVYLLVLFGLGIIFAWVAPSFFSIETKQEAWVAALKLFFEHPLGVGLGKYTLSVSSYTTAGFIGSAENFYLQFLSELGMVFIIPFCILLCPLLACIKKYYLSPGIVLIMPLLGVLLDGIFNQPFLVDGLYVLSSAALAACYKLYLFMGAENQDLWHHCPRDHEVAHGV